MKYRTLGKDLTVSAVSLGCMGMTHAYGAPSEEKPMLELIAQAVDLGCTMFDTAECYIGTNPYIVPIPGTRKPERLMENLGAADVELTADEIAKIDELLSGMKPATVYGVKR